MAFLQKGLTNILAKSPNDVVILSALRTPVTRAKKGGLKTACDHQLLSSVLKATLEANPNLDPLEIEDIHVGTVLSELGGSKAGRMAALHAGYPISTSFQTVNRACSSGLSAITGVSHAIALHQIDVGIGAGTESMTRGYGSRAIPTALWEELRQSRVKDGRDCLLSMGSTAENIADQYGISREEQDTFALRSHQKRALAREKCLLDKEIVPVTVPISADLKLDMVSSVQAQVVSVMISQDDGIRANATMENLAAMKPTFKSDGSGTATAGNSSQVSDGAAAVLMMRRSVAIELGLNSSIIGK